MSSKAVFTIVAKNYIAQARTLGDSLARFCPDIAFYIVLTDMCDEYVNPDEEKYIIIEAAKLNYPNFTEMCFKYNVIELSTAIKPFAFDYFINNLKHDKVLYLDPDICVFSPLDELFSQLGNSAILMTPHILTPQVDYTGLQNEGHLLFVGIYNFGFVGLNNSSQARSIVDWWKARLASQCFADKIEGLHVDQKWMDFIPAFFPCECRILTDLGCNVAFWNLHERKIEKNDGEYYVSHRIGELPAAKLKFFHFAAFDPYNPNIIHKNNPQISRSNYPDINDLFETYSSWLQSNGFANTVKYPYSYARYNNGDIITTLHRRLYRRLVEEKYPICIGDPFNTSIGSFYSLLKQNRLVSYSSGIDVEKLNELNYDYVSKMKVINTACRLLLRVIGVDRYTLLMKFMMRYSRYENQANLLVSAGRFFPLINENRRSS